MVPLKNQVFQVFLQANNRVDYVAGQYLEVVLPDPKGSRNVPLSIANAEGVHGEKISPNSYLLKGTALRSETGNFLIELHIRHTPGHTVSDALIKTFQISLQESQNVTIQLPFGRSTIAHLSRARQTILAARGTGFAPIKAVIEAMQQCHWHESVHLYWDVRLPDDHYLTDLPKQWINTLPHFRYTPLVSSEESEALIYAVLKDYPDLSSYQMMAAGPFDLMFKARDVWCAHGLNRAHMHSDAFLGE